MSINTIESEWQNVAIDDGESIVSENDYDVELSGSSLDTLSAQVESISFSPKVNAAPSLTVKVPPTEKLFGDDYIAETLKLFVNGNLAFQGEIRKIRSSEDFRNNFTITARSKGRELAGSTDRRTITNEISYDAIAKEIDEHNDYDSNHDEMNGTGDESFSSTENLGSGVIGTTDSASSGTVTYSSVGSDATQIDVVRAKIYTPSDITIKIDTASSSYSETFSTQNKNLYGEWVTVTPDDSLASESYDLEFTINGDALLHYWISITDNDVKRNVHTPDVSDLEQDTFIYERVGSEVTQTNSVHDGVWVENEDIRTRQVTSWNPIEFTVGGNQISNVTEATDSENSCNGRYIELPRGFTTQDISGLFDITNDFQDWAFRFRMRVSDSGPGNNSVDVNADHYWDMNIHVNGVEHTVQITTDDLYTSGSPDTDFQWLDNDIFHDFKPAWDNPIESLDEFRIGTSPTTDGDEVEIDVIILLHDSKTLNYTYDDTVDSNDNLSRPYKYATSDVYSDTPTATFSSFITNDNIKDSQTTVKFNTTSNIFGNWGPRQSIAFTSAFPNDPPDHSTNSRSFVYPGITHRVNIAFGAAGERSHASPTQGYRPMYVQSYQVYGSFNDLDVIHDWAVSENRLSTISKIGDRSEALFRFDGDTAEIFQTGLLSTDATLYEEDIFSSVSIQDAYASCEVIGKNNITSGVIEADDPPDFITDHKEIRDEELESVEACVREAVDFLRENSTVKYQGEVTSLPTFAPLGEQMSGSMFPHGKDMIINSVRYGKRRASIKLGKERDLSRKLINVATRSGSSSRERTRKGMRVPVGQDEFRD